MNKFLYYSVVVLLQSLSSSYCIDINIDYDNREQISIMPQDSSIFTDNQLRDIVRDSSEILSCENEYAYGVLDINNLRIVVFEPSKLSNIINDVLISTYNKIKSKSDPKSKINVADTFYRIIYNPTKLLFLECYSDLNLLETVNDIVNELKPFCRRYAIANLGKKPILYGMEKLEASLSTINNQFITGLNFQIDFNRTESYNKKKFYECYDKILLDIPTMRNCIDRNLLNTLIQDLVYYCENGNTLSYIIKYYSKSENILTNNIDRYVTILSNLKSFLQDNKDSILENVQQISINRINLFNEAWDTQIEKVDINELLDKFFIKLDNVDNLPENEKIDTYHAFFNILLLNKYIRKKVLLINNIEIINKLNSLFKRKDIREANINGIFEIQRKLIWNSKKVKNCIETENKLDTYYSMITMFCNNCVHKKINPIIYDIKDNKNSNNKELKNTILEFLEEMKNYMFNETKKHEIFLNKKQSLVHNNFWKQKQIDFKNY